MNTRIVLSLALMAGVFFVKGQTLWVPGGNIGNLTSGNNVGIGIDDPQAKLHVNGNITNGGSDFRLGINDGRDQQLSNSGKTKQRALVHNHGDVLHINYAGDFEGGVRVSGEKLRLDGALELYTTEDYSHNQEKNIIKFSNNYSSGSGNQKYDGASIRASRRGAMDKKSTDLLFSVQNPTEGLINVMRLHNSGHVGIGNIDDPDSKLTIKDGVLELYSNNSYGSNQEEVNALKFSSDYNGGQKFTTALIKAVKRSGDGRNDSDLYFSVSNADKPEGIMEVMRLHYSGNVGIGSIDDPKAKLTVDGNIWSKEIKCLASVVPDYVFADDYDLPTLEETESYIQANHHLPGIPSAKEVEENNGFELGKMNMKLLEKVEELTLHLIEQNKENKKQQKTIDALLKRIEKLESK